MICENQTDGKGCVWITQTNTTVIFNLKNIWGADVVPNTACTVEVDGNGPPDAVVANGVLSVPCGPMNLIGQGPAYSTLQVIGPDKQHQTGFLNGHILGQTDAARRGFPPTAVRFANLALTSPASWTTLGSGAIATGITAPDGTSGAGTCSSSSGNANCYFFNSVRTFTVGDIVIFGAWVQAKNATGFNSNEPIGWSVQGCGACLFQDISGTGPIFTGTTLQTFILGDGNAGNPSADWEWYYKILKVTGTSGSPANVQFVTTVSATRPVNVYGPMFLHIAANTLSDNEAASFGLNLQPYNNNCPVGSQCLVTGPAGSGGGGIVPPVGDIGGTTGSPTVIGLEGITLPTLGGSTGYLYDSAGTLSLSTSASNFTTGTLPHAQLPALVSGDIPNNAANTSGTAANATTAATATTASNLIGCIGAAAGDVCYYTGSAWAKLTGNTVSTQWLQETSSGVPSWTTPAGSGNVSTSGSPAAHQVPIFQSSTTIAGTGPGTTGYSLISNGASSDPSFQQVSLTAGVTGLLPNANLANPSATINTQTCTLGSSCTIPFSVLGSNNSSQNGTNFIASTVNALGLVVTPSNPSSNNVKFEITGPSFGTVTHTTGALVKGQPTINSPASTADIITSFQSIDVSAYGVTGNGATDDTAAFQAAANAIPTSGGTLVVPASFTPLISSTDSSKASNAHSMFWIDWLGKLSFGRVGCIPDFFADCGIPNRDYRRKLSAERWR